MFVGLFAFVCVSLIRPALLTCIADFKFLKHPHPLWICVCLAGRRRTALGQYLKGTGWIRGEGLEGLMVKTRPFIYILTELPAQHT